LHPFTQRRQQFVMCGAAAGTAPDVADVAFRFQSSTIYSTSATRQAASKR
jgi:hypothetical protein